MIPLNKFWQLFPSDKQQCTWGTVHFLKYQMDHPQ